MANGPTKIAALSRRPENATLQILRDRSKRFWSHSVFGAPTVVAVFVGRRFFLWRGGWLGFTRPRTVFLCSIESTRHGTSVEGTWFTIPFPIPILVAGVLGALAGLGLYATAVIAVGLLSVLSRSLTSHFVLSTDHQALQSWLTETRSLPPDDGLQRAA